jgi:hypothetical protein
VRITLALAGIALGVLLGVAPVAAIEQTITPLTPPEEQRVEVLGGGAAQEGVQAIETTELAAVEPHVPPSPAAKSASTAGKVALGVTAAAVSLAAMAASLLFL